MNFFLWSESQIHSERGWYPITVKLLLHQRAHLACQVDPVAFKIHCCLRLLSFLLWPPAWHLLPQGTLGSREGASNLVLALPTPFPQDVWYLQQQGLTRWIMTIVCVVFRASNSCCMEVSHTWYWGFRLSTHGCCDWHYPPVQCISVHTLLNKQNRGREWWVSMSSYNPTSFTFSFSSFKPYHPVFLPSTLISCEFFYMLPPLAIPPLMTSFQLSGLYRHSKSHTKLISKLWSIYERQHMTFLFPELG